jgi:hypothetical protein
VSLTPPKNLSAVSLTPVNSFSPVSKFVSLLVISDLYQRLRGKMLLPVSTTPAKKLFTGVNDTADYDRGLSFLQN